MNDPRQTHPKLFDALSEIMDGAQQRVDGAHIRECPKGDADRVPSGRHASQTAYVGEWLKTANPAFDNGPVFRSTESGHVAAPRLGTTPLQVIERGEADRIWNTCHGVTLRRRMIYRLQTGEPL